MQPIPIEGAHPPASDAPRVRIVLGTSERIIDSIDSICATAASELLVCTDPRHLIGAGLSGTGLTRLHDIARAAARRGVTGRQMAVMGAASDRSVASVLQQTGWETRAVSRVPAKMLIVDRLVALIPLDMRVFVNGFVVIAEPAIVETLAAQFDLTWSALNGEPETTSEPHPPERFYDIIQLLKAGFTDDEAAPCLGVSLRTYTRRMAELHTELGSTSRFQAGLEAARRGWA